jgi:glucosamine--fructose-6-phosphate aminotransferase (isomerizing)
MCSVFGFVARRQSPVDLHQLRKIVEANIRRGPHAFGFAWIDSRDRLHCYKQAGRLTDAMGVLSLARDARMLIGHLRYSTHGSPTHNINNHPHPVDGGWLVHNGVIRNYERLLDRYDIAPVSECDSEVLSHLVERSPEATYVRRTAEAVDRTEGPLATLALWARPNKLIAVRRGNPLHYGYTAAGVYLATLDEGLPGKIREAADGFAVEMDARGTMRRSVKLQRRDLAEATLYDPSTYRGG